MAKTEFFELSIPAIPVNQKDFVLYLSAVKASDLFNLCEGLKSDEFSQFPLEGENDNANALVEQFITSVSKSPFPSGPTDLGIEPYDEEVPFQRIIDNTRVKRIAAYLQEESAVLPNAIILATKKDTSCEFENGQLRLQWSDPLPASIIDGQHRVEALKLLARDAVPGFENYSVPVCWLVGVPFYMQAELFAVINGRQKSVSRSRVYDLLGYMPVTDSNLKERAYKGEMKIHRFCHHAVQVLNTSSISPWLNRIKMRGSGRGVVTQGAMVDHMAELVIPRRDTLRLKTLPVLYSYFVNNDLVGISKACVIYFLGISKAWPQFWSDDQDLHSSLFGKTNGVAVMFSVLHDMILLEGGADKLTIAKVQQHWKSVPEDLLSSPPAGGSKGYQSRVYSSIISSILGPNHEHKLRRAADSFKSQLYPIQGLLGRATF